MRTRFEHEQKLSEIILKKIPLYAQEVIHGNMLRHHSLQVYSPENMDAMVVRLCALICGDTKVLINESFPATWWDALKVRWFPTFLLKRYPAVMRNINVDQLTLFPSIEVPNHMPLIRVYTKDYHSLLHTQGAVSDAPPEG